MDPLTIIKIIFLFIGLVLLVVAFFMLKSTIKFLKNSLTVRGKVTDMLSSKSSNSSSKVLLYNPVIQFTTKRGKNHEFTSAISSSPPKYEIGENVEVLYNRNQPKKAKVKSFFSLWGGISIVGGLGALFFIVGTFIFFLVERKNNEVLDLKLNGQLIETDFKNIVVNYSITLNERHPFQIVSHWKSPSTLEEYIFKSDNIWFNPSKFIEGKKVKVFIDKDNPKKYYVDISELPKQLK